MTNGAFIDRSKEMVGRNVRIKLNLDRETFAVAFYHLTKTYPTTDLWYQLRNNEIPNAFDIRLLKKCGLCPITRKGIVDACSVAQVTLALKVADNFAVTLSTTPLLLLLIYSSIYLRFNQVTK